MLGLGDTESGTDTNAPVFLGQKVYPISLSTRAASSLVGCSPRQCDPEGQHDVKELSLSRDSLSAPAASSVFTTSV